MNKRFLSQDSPAPSSQVFISYARANAKAVQIFAKHFDSVASNTGLKSFSDERIKPGERWPEAIERALKTSDAGILFVSKEFLESKWCSHEAESLFSRLPQPRVIPVLLAACLWGRAKWLSDYNFANIEPILRGNKIDEDILLATVERVQEVLSSQLGVAQETKSAPPARYQLGREVKWEAFRPDLTAGNGRISFVLGSGIHDSRTAALEADDLRARVYAVLSALQDEPRAQAYVRDLVETNLPGALAQPNAASEPAEWEGQLLKIQSSLAKLGAFANRLFNARLARSRKHAFDTSSLRIELLPGADSTQNLRSYLFSISEDIYQLIQSGEISHEQSVESGLGLRGILEQFVALTFMIFGPHLAAPQDDEARHWYSTIYQNLTEYEQQSIESLKLRGDGRLHLSLYQLEWLGDLLWHTLRFDSGLHPKPSELAFQISVCTVPFTPPRRESMGTLTAFAIPPEYTDKDLNLDIAVERLEQLADRIAGWLSGRHSDRTNRTYSALARILCHRMKPSPRGGPHPIDHDRLPIAITTDLSNGLERAFTKPKVAHHILFPVYRRRETESGVTTGYDYTSEWLLMDKQWSSAASDPVTKWHLLDQEEGLRQTELFGPLVVKLYGSPMINISQPDVKLKDPLTGRVRTNGDLQSFFFHRLIVSDIDLLALLMQDEWWPEGLIDLLYGKTRRRIFLLGYSLSDFDNRLRLYDQVRRSEKGKSDRTLLMPPPQDPIHLYYLRRMNTNATIVRMEQLYEAANSCDPLEEN